MGTRTDTRGSAPYVPGDHLQVTGPHQDSYRVCVARVTPCGDGFEIVATVSSPRRYRDKVIVTRVDAEGLGPHISV